VYLFPQHAKLSHAIKRSRSQFYEISAKDKLIHSVYKHGEKRFS